MSTFVKSDAAKATAEREQVRDIDVLPDPDKGAGFVVVTLRLNPMATHTMHLNENELQELYDKAHEHLASVNHWG